MTHFCSHISEEGTPPLPHFCEAAKTGVPVGTGLGYGRVKFNVSTNQSALINQAFEGL